MGLFLYCNYNIGSGKFQLIIVRFQVSAKKVSGGVGAAFGSPQTVIIICHLHCFHVDAQRAPLQGIIYAFPTWIHVNFSVRHGTSGTPSPTDCNRKSHRGWWGRCSLQIIISNQYNNTNQQHQHPNNISYVFRHIHTYHVKCMWWNDQLRELYSFLICSNMKNI